MSTNTLTHGQADNPLAGVLFLLLGASLFSVQDVIIKGLSGAYPAHEIVFVRGLVGLIPLSLIVFREGGFDAFKTNRPLLLILRGLTGFACYTTYYMALTVLPLADAATLFYANPLIVTALSVPLLKEFVGLRRWVAVIVGFLGVLVVLRPGAESFEPAMIFAIVAAVLYALMIMITRWIGKAESGATMSFYSMAVFIAASAVAGMLFGDGQWAVSEHPSMQFLFRAWVWPSWSDFGLLTVCGLIAGVGFFCLTQAYRLATPSVVSPFEYSSLLWAALWGFVFWDDLPDLYTLAGIILVVGSGLYIIRRETVRGRRVVSSRPLRIRV